MLDMFNAATIDSLAKVARLNTKQKDIIGKKQPYRRFWEIGRTEGVGKKTYATLFTHFYNKATGDSTNEQVSIFDIE